MILYDRTLSCMIIYDHVRSYMFIWLSVLYADMYDHIQSVRSYNIIHNLWSYMTQYYHIQSYTITYNHIWSHTIIHDAHRLSYMIDHDHTWSFTITYSPIWSYLIIHDHRWSSMCKPEPLTRNPPFSARTAEQTC